ncbi:MAG: hypothetical protein GY835_09265, partial [bacterium]|nr:hypothetical protein [bacterium]
GSFVCDGLSGGTGTSGDPYLTYYSGGDMDLRTGESTLWGDGLHIDGLTALNQAWYSTPGGPGVGVLNWDFTFQAVDNGVLWSVHATWSGVVPNQFGAYPPFCLYGGQTNADAATLAAVVSQDPVFSSPVYLPGMDVTVTATDLSEVWIDDDYTAGGANDGHIWGYTAFDNIQAGIDAVVGSTVNVAPGTYGPFFLNKSVNLLGAQVGTTAVGRVIGAPNPTIESIITAGGGILCDLQTGCAGSVIDGFAFVAGLNAIKATSGPLDNLVLQNNHVEGTTDPSILLDRHLSGDDITVHQNSLDGASLSPGGPASTDALFLMDLWSNWDGFRFTSNHLKNAPSHAAGFYVDACVVGTSGTRDILFEGNLFQNIGASGIVAGSYSLYGGEIRDNTFDNVAYGILGGPQGVLIKQNTFMGCSGGGLVYFSAHPSGPTRGAQNSTATENVFFGNAIDVWLFNTQVSGTMATNVFVDNSFGSTVAVDWAGDGSAAVLDFSGNWWGSNTGPTIASHPAGTGGAINGGGANLIDFSPWLASGTDTAPGTPGFQGDFSTLNVDDDSPQAGASGLIQEGINLVSGSTINVAPGTYVEVGQVVINKSVTIIGDAGNNPIVMTDQSTGGTGDSRGWFLVQAGNTVDISNIIFDGSGYQIFQGFRHKGNGSFTDCTFRHIKYHESTQYKGYAVAAQADGPVDFTGCVFSDIGRVGVAYYLSGCSGSVYDGNTYTGKGVGNWLDYGVEITSGASVTIQNSTITSCKGVATPGGWTSAAVNINNHYAPGAHGIVTRNNLSGNASGIGIGIDASDTSTLLARYNDLSNNSDYGVEKQGPNVVDALHNWWGAVDGPSSVGTGSGVNVTANVLFDPWLTGNVFMTPDPQTISLADSPGYAKEIVCEYQGGGSGGIYGYSIDLIWDLDVVTASFAKPDNGPFASPTLFYVTNLSSGSVGHVKIDATLPGATPGITSGELFKGTFTAVGTVDYDTSSLGLTFISVRDEFNAPVTGLVADNGLVIVDLGAPVVSGVAIANSTLGHTDEYLKNGDNITVTATVTDSDPGFGAANITADLGGFGLGATVTPDTYAAPTATWNVGAVGTTTPADGLITVQVTATDLLLNTSNGNDTITADNTIPTAVSGFACAPAHNEIDCTWDDASGNDTNYYQMIVMDAAWGDYPNYTGSAAGWPAAVLGSAKWTGTGTATTLIYNGAGGERDIMSLQAFVVDQVLHVGPADAGAQGRATNYWLGDVSDQGSGTYGIFDGLVSGADITQLGTYYGTSTVVVAGEPIDVGPTVGGSRTGLPLPDDYVNFEDLMIFSMNYGVVAPLPIFQENATELAQITWRRVEENVWSLVLDQPCLDLKGLNISSRMIAGSVISVQPGALCGQQAGQVFLRNIDANGLDAGLALMGTDLALIGSGELMRVTFAQGITPDDITLALRNSLNAPVGVEMEMTGVADDLPAAYMMTQNFPNPFNPKTRISFDLPEAQNVRLSVFAPDGRCIITLVNEAVAAGHHSVTWNGRDSAGQSVASGVYFYSIDAGPLQKTSKMLLLK